MILSNQQIVTAYRSGDVLIDPFVDAQVQAASYDLRVGAQAATTTAKRVIDIAQDGFVVIEPGDFGVVATHEVIRLGPQYVGRFGLRSKFARQGLIAADGPQIDPGFHGRLVIGVSNLTPKPIVLSHKEDFVTVEFNKLAEASTKPYSGPYQGKTTIGSSDIEAIMQKEGIAFSEVLTTLRSLSTNVAVLTQNVQQFEQRIGRHLTIVSLIAAVAIGVCSIVAARN